MTKVNRAAKSALMISMLTLGSKFLGFIREMLIAAKFGSGMETDTFFVALTATSLITTLLTTAISTTFVPVLTEIEEFEGKEGKIKHTSNMINITLAVAAVLIAIAWFFAPLIIRLTAKGFEGEQFDLAVKLMRIGLPMILFSGVIGSFTGFLHSERRHISSAAIGFPMNIVYIVFLLVFSTKYGITGLMVAAVIATASQFLIQVPEAKRAGFKYSPIFDPKDIYVRRVLQLSIPVLIGVAINDLNAIVNRTMASDLVDGSISALNYGDKLNALVQGVFIVAITTVIFPILAKEANQGRIDRMKKVMGEGINLVLLITIPATVGIIVLAQPIVEVAFERGEFTAADTIMTKQALIFYSLGLVAMGMRLLITRVYYSLHNTRTPMINGALSVGFNILLNLILIRFMAHAGLAFATSISVTVATLILFYGLKKRIGSLGTFGYIKTGIKSLAASAPMGVVAYLVYNVLHSILGSSSIFNLIALVAAVGAGAIVYYILCYLFKVEQVRDLTEKVLQRLKRS